VVLLCAASGLVLSGCTGLPWRRPLVLYVALTTPPEERITRELAQLFRQRFDQLVLGFRRLHPNVMVQISLYPQDELLGQMRFRSRSGLGPDLIVTSADNANALLREGLTQPMPVTPEEARQVDPQLLRWVRDPSGRLAGQPLVVYAQLACFNRERLPQPPATVRDLLQLSADGLRVGLALTLRDQLWSAGSFGALPALQEAVDGRDPDPVLRGRLRAWMQWLQDANVQRDVTFVADAATQRDGFRRGLFDWITCHSSDVSSLRTALGERLGISTLPDGEGFQATPVNPLRVIALGSNSSSEQRAMALALTRYSMRPLVQRSFTLDTEVFLPVNRYVSVPAQASPILATLLAARRQGIGAESLLANMQADDPRVARLEQVIVPLLFGVIDPDQAMQDTLRILQEER